MWTANVESLKALNHVIYAIVGVPALGHLERTDSFTAALEPFWSSNHTSPQVTLNAL